MSPSVLIVGGGIGGLTAAIALRCVGIPARIVEQAPSIAVVGSGITIQSNAKAILDVLGVEFPAEDVRPIRGFAVRSARGPTLMGATVELPPHWPESVAIHRADLHRALVARLEALGGTLELGKPIVALRTRDDGVDGVLANGEVVPADLLIGADGLRSTIRRHLLGKTAAEVRFAGQTCWRFAEVFPEVVVESPVEIWAGARRCGLVPLSRDRLYVYLVETAFMGTPAEGEPSAADLQRRFAGIDPTLDRVLQTLVARTESGNPPALHHGDLFDQPRRTFGLGRVALLGDAGHATTPNMGQGAGMAIEDAASLAIAFRSGAVPLSGIVEHLDAIRHDRVAKVQKTSYRIGQVAHWQAGWLQMLRDGVFSMTPASSQKARVEDLLAPGIELSETLRSLLDA